MNRYRQDRDFLRLFGVIIYEIHLRLTLSPSGILLLFSGLLLMGAPVDKSAAEMRSCRAAGLFHETSLPDPVEPKL